MRACVRWNIYIYVIDNNVCVCSCARTCVCVCVWGRKGFPALMPYGRVSNIKFLYCLVLKDSVKEVKFSKEANEDHGLIVCKHYISVPGSQVCGVSTFMLDCSIVPMNSIIYYRYYPSDLDNRDKDGREI